MRRLYLKTWKVYFFTVDVKLESHSIVFQEYPDAVAAVVDCIIPAQNKREATEILRELLESDGYTLRKILASGNFLDYRSEDKQKTEEYYSYAWAAYCDGIPAYGTFWAYDEIEESAPLPKRWSKTAVKNAKEIKRMTVTLEIPPDLDGTRREVLAATLLDVGLITSAQAAALMAEAQTAPFSSGGLRQGSLEWKALLYQAGPGHGVILPPEATSREAIYGEELR